MKYIDAEKLKKVIEGKGLDCSFALKMERLDTLALIDELQQEQPEGLHFTPLNRLIQKIPSKNWNDTVNNYAKKLRDCLIKEGYLKDAKVLQDYISYMNGNNVPMATMDEQEQPEVDLEKIIEQTYQDGSVADTSNIEPEDYKYIARYFWNKGYNARKEENKWTKNTN